MSIIKFNQKNKSILTDIEGTANQYQTGMVAADAVLATTISGSVKYETGTIEFMGDSNSRDEYSWTKDSSAEFSVETPQQVLGTLNPSLVASTIPLFDLYSICGGNVSVNGSTGVTTITNNVTEISTGSINYVKTSADDATNGKLFRFYGVRGTVDLSADISDVPRLKFALKGNALPPITAAIVAPDYASQSTSIASEIRQSTVITAAIAPYSENFNSQSVITGTPTIAFSGNIATVTLASHGLTTGRLVNISGCTGAVDAYYYNGDFVVTVLTANTFTYIMNGTPGGVAAGTIVAKKDGYSKTFCFDKLQAPNFFGFDLARYLTACEEGFDRKAMASDVTVSMLETHTPSYNIASISRTGSTATITTDIAHGLSAGNSITVSGATDPLFNGTFLCATASGTSITYVMGGTPVGASAVATYVGALVFVNNSSLSFEPSYNISKFFTVKLKFGKATGRYTTYLWDKLQLKEVKDVTVATSEGKELVFRSTGKAFIILE